jgi:hypothetical protein
MVLLSACGLFTGVCITTDLFVKDFSLGSIFSVKSTGFMALAFTDTDPLLLFGVLSIFGLLISFKGDVRGVGGSGAGVDFFPIPRKPNNPFFFSFLL